MQHDHGVGRPNPWYPRHVSDRADELMDELDHQAQAILCQALGGTTFDDWCVWLQTERQAIGRHDSLAAAARRRRLKQRPVDVLRLQHACIYLELWRARLASHYMPLPPHGLPLDTPAAHREFMLCAVASFEDLDTRDLWPFDLPEGVEHHAAFPFRRAA